jgi:hypothetical protein
MVVMGCSQRQRIAEVPAVELLLLGQRRNFYYRRRSAKVK